MGVRRVRTQLSGTTIVTVSGDMTSYPGSGGRSISSSVGEATRTRTLEMLGARTALRPPASDWAEASPPMSACMRSGRGESSATRSERRARPSRSDGSHSSPLSVATIVRLRTAVRM